jgi:hypothetical protein
MPNDEIALKKNKCGCVMEMGFTGDEVRRGPDARLRACVCARAFEDFL